MNILKANIHYWPQARMPSSFWTLRVFSVDEPKLNLLWLLCPEVDDVWLSPWPGNVVGAAIDTLFYPALRDALSMPPLAFVDWWLQSQAHDGQLGQMLPQDYYDTMLRRAVEANTRLTEGLPVNAVKVDFKTRRKYG